MCIKLRSKAAKIAPKKCMLYMSSMVMHFCIVANAILIKKPRFEKFFV